MDSDGLDYTALRNLHREETKPKLFTMPTLENHKPQQQTQQRKFRFPGIDRHQTQTPQQLPFFSLKPPAAPETPKPRPVLAPTSVKSQNRHHFLPPSRSQSPASSFRATDENSDIPDMLIGAIKELAEQRRYSHSLQAQLASAKSDNESLVQRNAHLTRDVSHSHDEQSRTAESLQSVRAELEVTRLELLDIKKRFEDTKEENKVLRQECDARKGMEKERDEMKRVVGLVRRSLVTLRNENEDLQNAFTSLKASNGVIQDALRRALDEVREVKVEADERMQVLKTVVDDSGSYIKAAETKLVVAELQEGLADSHRVTDLLRDKLFLQSTHVVEARERIRELEGEGKIERDRAGEKVIALAEQLARREQEVTSAIAEARGVEGELEVTQETLMGVKKMLADVEVEVERERDKKKALEIMLVETRERLGGIAEELKTQVHALEKELLTKVALEESRVELRASLERAESQLFADGSMIKSLEAEAKAAALREAVANSRCETLEGETERLGRNMEAKDAMLREANSKLSVLQDRLESQAVTLRLAKEQAGDLQERLVSAESSFAMKLESSTGQLRLSLALLEEQKSNLFASLESQREAFSGASAEFEKKTKKQEEVWERLVQSEARRAEGGEREVRELKERVSVLASELDTQKTRRREAEELIGRTKDEVRRIKEEMGALKEDVGRERVEMGKVREKESKEVVKERKKMEQEIEQQLEVGRESRKEIETMTVELGLLKARVGELGDLNRDLVERAVNLPRRHQEGLLNDEEKDFVNSIIQMTHSIHEQEAVARGNELRRRENMINTLQARVRELESTLAKLLKEKGKEDGRSTANSVVGPDFWLSSSPHGLNDANQAASNMPCGTAASTVLDSSAPPSTSVSVPVAAVAVPPNRPKLTIKSPKQLDSPRSAHPLAATAFVKLAESDSDEEDIPLSELPHTSAVSLGKRDRAPSPPMIPDEFSRSGRRLRGAGAVRKSDAAPMQGQEVAQKKIPEKTKQQKKRK